MLLSAKANVEGFNTAAVAKETAGTGKIALSGIPRLTVKTADTGKIRLGGACRLPVKSAR
jgi:hypothetical protein